MCDVIFLYLYTLIKSATYETKSMKTQELYLKKIKFKMYFSSTKKIYIQPQLTNSSMENSNMETLVENCTKVSARKG